MNKCQAVPAETLRTPARILTCLLIKPSGGRDVAAEINDFDS